MLITCSEKRRLMGDDRTPWKHRGGMCCPVSPLCLAEGKHSDCSKGYLTRGENILVTGIVWRGVMAPLQAFNSSPDKHLAREADRARGGSDRPALSPYSFICHQMVNAGVRPNLPTGVGRQRCSTGCRDNTSGSLNLCMCAVLFDRSPRTER